MAGGQGRSALGHIERLFSEGSATGFSDTQLLHRFATTRDEIAFSVLLARHGPMVMSVCQGVLRNRADAEDAFQATFLILARKAGSSWGDGQLGGWLHRVAYRVAIRARADHTRRRGHERRVAEWARAEYAHEPVDETRPVLHDELARLPTKMRLPVVLCYLEGLTQAEAAIELRCGEATLRRRLAVARDRLRVQLIRRGIAPAAAVSSASLAGEATAAVAPACVRATLTAASRISAGEAMAIVASSQVYPLTRGGWALMTHGWKAFTAATLSLATVAGVAVAITAATGKDAELPPEPAARPANQHAQVAKPGAKPAGQHTIEGVVVGPDGKPVVGAEVYWLGESRYQKIYNARPKGFKEKPDFRERTIAKASTNAEGKFTLTAEFDSAQYVGRSVIVKTQNAGLSGRLFFGETVTEEQGGAKALTFRLRPTTTIEGRLLTTAGAPAMGVKVILEEFHDKESEFEADMVSSGQERPDDEPRHDFWQRYWITGKDGRFRIEGVVPEKMVARLHFRHPDLADDDLFVSTGLPLSDWLRAFDAKPVDAKFVHTLEPARPVTGVVTDKETGKPLEGVLVQMLSNTMQNRYGGLHHVFVRTDAAGRYRAAGMAGKEYWVTAYPDPSSGYISIEKRERSWPAGAKTLQIDLALPRPKLGVLRGRVVEAGTDRPVAGASVLYQPEPRNKFNRDEYEFRNPVLTDEKGVFATTVLSGKGVLAVEAPTGDYIRGPVYVPSNGRSGRAHPHGYLQIDMADERKENSPVTIPVRKGVKLEARLLAPDGTTVTGMVLGWHAEIMASQVENHTSPDGFTDGHFFLEGADPNRTYRAYFLEPKQRLGAVVELKYDPKGAREIRLQPTATAKGIVVDPKGRPLKDTQILPWIVLTSDDRDLKPRDFTLDDDGKVEVYSLYTMEPLLQSYPADFHYDKLIPGVRYYVSAGGTYHKIPILKPGEVLDLGKIVAKPVVEE